MYQLVTHRHDETFGLQSLLLHVHLLDTFTYHTKFPHQNAYVLPTTPSHVTDQRPSPYSRSTHIHCNLPPQHLSCVHSLPAHLALVPSFRGTSCPPQNSSLPQRIPQPLPKLPAQPMPLASTASLARPIIAFFVTAPTGSALYATPVIFATPAPSSPSISILLVNSQLFLPPQEPPPS